MTPFQIAELTKARVVIDCVNAWDEKEWKHAGFELFKMGWGNDYGLISQKSAFLKKWVEESKN